MAGYSPSKNWYQDRTASRFFFFRIVSSQLRLLMSSRQPTQVPSERFERIRSKWLLPKSYDPTWQYEQPPCSIGQNHMKNNEQPPFSIGQNMPKPSISFSPAMFDRNCSKHPPEPIQVSCFFGRRPSRSGLPKWPSCSQVGGWLKDDIGWALNHA